MIWTVDLKSILPVHRLRLSLEELSNWLYEVEDLQTIVDVKLEVHVADVIPCRLYGDAQLFRHRRDSLPLHHKVENLAFSRRERVKSRHKLAIV